MSPFREVIKARKKYFISYEEVVSKLATATGSSLAEVAKALMIEGVHKNNAVWISGVEEAPCPSDGDWLGYLMEHTAKNNEIAPVDNFAFGGDILPSQHGWIRAKLLEEFWLWFDISSQQLETLKEPDAHAYNTFAASDTELVKVVNELREKLREASEEREVLKSQLLQAAREADNLRRLIRPEEELPLHYSGLMKIAIEVQRTYWASEGARPKQEAVVAEIVKKYQISNEQARAVERVACPINRRR